MKINRPKPERLEIKDSVLTNEVRRKTLEEVFVDFKDLPPRQRIFIREYIQDYNGTAAALRCGYAESCASVVANQILKKEKVRQAIDQFEKSLATCFISTKSRVLKEMSLLAYSDVGDFIPSGALAEALNIAELPPQATRAIKKIKFYQKARTLARKGPDGDVGDRIEETKIDLELHDKQGALVKMGQEIGMFRERKELTGADGQPLIPAGPTTIVFDFGGE